MEQNKKITYSAVIALVGLLLFTRAVFSDPSINGNIIYLDPGERLYISCEDCEGVVYNEEYSYVQGMQLVGARLDGTPIVTLTMEPSPTFTPLPVETGQPVPTITQPPTATTLPTIPPTLAATSTIAPEVTNTPVVITTPDTSPCVAPWVWASSENIDIISDAFELQGIFISDDGPKTYHQMVALNDNDSWNPNDTLTFCFFVDKTADYKVELRTVNGSIKEESFYLTFSKGGPDLIEPQIVEWSGISTTSIFVAEGRKNKDITIEAVTDDIVTVSLGSRESNARLLFIRLIEDGLSVEPTDTPTAVPTPDVSTPEIYPISTQDPYP